MELVFVWDPLAGLHVIPRRRLRHRSSDAVVAFVKQVVIFAVNSATKHQEYVARLDQNRMTDQCLTWTGQILILQLCARAQLEHETR